MRIKTLFPKNMVLKIHLNLPDLFLNSVLAHLCNLCTHAKFYIDLLFGPDITVAHDLILISLTLADISTFGVSAIFALSCDRPQFIAVDHFAKILVFQWMLLHYTIELNKGTELT